MADLKKLIKKGKKKVKIDENNNQYVMGEPSVKDLVMIEAGEKKPLKPSRKIPQNGHDQDMAANGHVVMIASDTEKVTILPYLVCA